MVWCTLAVGCREEGQIDSKPPHTGAAGSHTRCKLTCASSCREFPNEGAEGPIN